MQKKIKSWINDFRVEIIEVSLGFDINSKHVQKAFLNYEV